ncbi:Uncharacterized protein Adt_28790 [Abeliophyllum distichum]|uniref:Uncharacterized protein n=1 Tax=Abeliophyllum distichum TaxID=126358 RepID=A0ABD1RZV7_9LAMI
MVKLRLFVVSFLLRGLYFQIYGLRPTLLWSFTASPRDGGPWSIQATLCHIRHLFAFDRDTISHIYREGNQVVDLLNLERLGLSLLFQVQRLGLTATLPQLGSN